MKEIKIFEEIANSKGYDIALITTFNFDVNFFERCILSRLYENGIRKISLFNDSKELNKAMTGVKYSSIGKKYMVNPIEMNGAFHPKVILLLGINRAKLFVSSANITTNGYYINNEIFNCIEYNEENLEYLQIIKDAISFFEGLNEISYKQDLKLFNEIKELVYYNKNIENKECYLIHNLNEDILSQISNKIKNVKQIDIAVPYYDNELNAIEQIKNIYPEAEINLYLQNGKCKFNKNKSNEKYKIKLFEGFDEVGTTNFYHGKVFRFITNQESYILYGSANCTESALTKTIKNYGNIECDILEKGTIEEFDYFFENFKIECESELDCNLISYKNENNQNFYYKYGKIDLDLKLYVGIKNNKENIKILYKDKELTYRYIDDKNIEITIGMEETFLVSDIFEIEIYYDNTKEKITCWFINTETLEVNRNTEMKEPLNKFEIDSQNDKYLEDRIALIKSMNLTYEEYLKELKNINIITQERKEITEEDEDDNGVVSYVVPTLEEIEFYHRNQMVRKIKNVYLERYLNNYVRNNKEVIKTVININKDNLNTNDEYRSRAITTNEMSFRRFIKSRANEMLKLNNYENIEIENYFSSILVFNEIFDKYTLKQKVDGLFERQYIIDIKKQFLLNLLKFKMNDINEEFKQAIIIICIESIIKNKYINDDSIENYKLDNINREILLKLNELFKIREDIKEYVEIAINGINTEIGLDFDYLIEEKYIDKLFGFKTDEQIINLLKREFEEDVEVNYRDKTLEIESKTSTIVKYLNLNQNIISEIIRHYKNYNKELNYIIIKIENLKNDYVPTADPIKYIIFEINIFNKNYTKKIVRKSDKTDNIEYYKLQTYNI